MIMKVTGGAARGTGDYLRHYQPTLKRLVDSKTDEELKVAEEQAANWNAQGPPQEKKSQ